MPDLKQLIEFGLFSALGVGIKSLVDYFRSRRQDKATAVKTETEAARLAAEIKLAEDKREAEVRASLQKQFLELLEVTAEMRKKEQKGYEDNSELRIENAKLRAENAEQKMRIDTLMNDQKIIRTQLSNVENSTLTALRELRERLDRAEVGLAQAKAEKDKVDK